MTIDENPDIKLVLRAQRRSETGADVISRDFTLPAGQPLRLGREPRMSAALPDFNPDRGADLIFPDDNHNSWDSAYRRSELPGWLIEMTD